MVPWEQKWGCWLDKDHIDWQMLQTFSTVLLCMSTEQWNANDTNPLQILHPYPWVPNANILWHKKSWNFDEQGVVTTSIDYVYYSLLSRNPSISSKLGSQNFPWLKFSNRSFPGSSVEDLISGMFGLHMSWNHYIVRSYTQRALPVVPHEAVPEVSKK